MVSTLKGVGDLKYKAWNMKKTSVRERYQSPFTSQNDIKVLNVPETKTGHAVKGSSCPGRTFLPLGQHPTWKENRHPMGRTLVGVKTFFGRLILSPSFLISSLIVFFLVPDSVLKGTCSIDLRSRCGEAMRRGVDIIGAILGLILTSPFFLLVPILVKLDSPGSVLFKQMRVGQERRNGDRRRNSYRLNGDRRNGDRRKKNAYGRLFVVYKFRSMREDAEKKSGPVWAKRNDPRITKVGKLLRAIRADELPQLFNVLKGDMSLVGPRPERPYFVDQFVGTISRYEERLKVKPGLTGLAQVMGGYDTCMEDVYSKLDYDLKYVDSKSLGHDLKILLKTIVVVICRKGIY